MRLHAEAVQQARQHAAGRIQDVWSHFNFPFVAKSVQEFWNRWHISLSLWCRDHIFFNLTKRLGDRFPDQPDILLSLIAVFATFIVLGTWHGSSMNWAISGVYQGTWICIGMAWRHLWETHHPDLYDGLNRSKAYQGACMFLTFNVISIGLLFTLETAQVSPLLRSLSGGTG